MSTYNERNAIPCPYVSEHPVDSDEFEKDVRAFQEKFGLTVDGKFGPNSLIYARNQTMIESCPVELDKDKIARIVSKFEGKYWSVNRDGEFRGLFDRNGKKHWASGKTHIGLSFGYIQFTQDGGALGELLELMHTTNGAKFRGIFGQHWEELLKTTNAKGKKRVKGRSPRVQPVGGFDLWEDYWVGKFQKAGRDEEFQACQRSLAISNYMNPAIKTCLQYGYRSERSLAIIFDRSVQHGPGGARRMFDDVEGDNEFRRIWNVYQRYKDRRWIHRLEKLWKSQELSDQALASL